MLAKFTGWTERFILWELPLTRALNYQHAALRGEGLWTVKPLQNAPAKIHTANLKSFFADT